MPTPIATRRRSRARRKTSPQTHLFQLDLVPEDDGSWTVDVPALPGCVTWGKTLDEALNHAQEAIALYVGVLRDEGRPIPAGVGVLAKPTVAVTV